MNEPLNIVINGWYGQLNAGDDAILDVFIDQTRARFDAHFTVLSEMPENIPSTPYMRGLFHPALLGRETPSALIKGRLWRHLREISKADLFVLGGGGILRDNTNWRNLLRLLDEVWFAKLLGKKVMLYGIGVGPFKTALGRKLIGISARMADLVTVRSERCAQLLRDVGVQPQRIHVVSDPAFLLAPRVPADAEIQRLFAPGKKTIGFYPTFALEVCYEGDEHFRQLAKALDEVSADPEVQLVSVPLSVLDNGVDDVDMARKIQSFMKHPERLYIYEKRLDAAELKWVTSQAILNMTVRLHAMIFSLGAGVPVVAVNYEPKVANVFSEFQSPRYLVEMGPELGQNLAQATQHALRNLPAYTAHICNRLALIAANSTRTFDLMRDLYPDRVRVAEYIASSVKPESGAIKSRTATTTEHH
ncbi:MAG TPA: polysaccharide pyruvyl transferase family protein [Telluria sp.]